MSSATETQPLSSVATRARYAVLALAALFAIGAATQLFLAGLNTFDGSLYWTEHVMLGRMVALFAFALPVVAYVGRLGRWFVVLSLVAAGLYLVQISLTYIDIGAVAALHALNALPLVIIPAMVALRVRETIRQESTDGSTPSR